MRSDIRGEYRAPAAVDKFLLKFGGKNPHGEPNYRLVHTSCVFVTRGGVWNDWPSSLSIQERGGLVRHPETGQLVPSQLKPIRRVAEHRSVLKYGHIPNRWLLERWCPAHMYGSKAVWEKLTVPFHPDLLMLGPYPEQGDYWMVAQASERVPTMSEIQRAIEECERLRDDHAASIEQACLEAHNEAVEEYEREAKSFMEDLELKMLDAMIPTGRISLAAGRHRNLLALRSGVKEHCGN